MNVDPAPGDDIRNDHEDDIHWEDLNVPRYVALNVIFIMCYDSILHPFDLIKTRQQFDHTSNRPLSVFQTASQVIKARGFRGLFTGLRASMSTNMPGHLVYFGSYEFAKQFQMDHFPELNHTQTCMISGMISEFTATWFHTPGDIVCRRLMVYPLDTKLPTDVIMLKEVTRKTGLCGLWRGVRTSIMTNAPSSAAWFGTYEWMKTQLHRRQIDTTIEQLLSGAAAGTASVLVSNPMDVARTLVQTSSLESRPMSMIQTLQYQVKTLGQFHE